MLLSWLRLRGALLLGTLMKRSGKILQCINEMNTEVSLGFVSLFNGFRDPFHSSR
jgi:hypothetical protein